MRMHRHRYRHRHTRHCTAGTDTDTDTGTLRHRYRLWFIVPLLLGTFVEKREDTFALVVNKLLNKSQNNIKIE